MKTFFIFLLLGATVAGVGHYVGFWSDFNNYAKVSYEYEKQNIDLIKQNKFLKVKLGQQNETVDKLSHQIRFIQSQGKVLPKRKIASIPNTDPNDLVQQEVYNWSPDKLRDTGAQALSRKEFEKAAQFYYTYLSLFPKDPGINAGVFFEAAIASYESKKHYDWAITYFQKYLESNPGLKFKLGAKLWLALSYFHNGNVSQYVEICKEFKTKYRNSREWDILSRHYEAIMEKHDLGHI